MTEKEARREVGVITWHRCVAEYNAQGRHRELKSERGRTVMGCISIFRLPMVDEEKGGECARV